MNDENEMKELFRIANETYFDRCINKQQLYELMQKNALFKDFDFTTRSDQTKIGLLLAKFINQTFNGITLQTLKRNKNNVLFSFFKTATPREDNKEIREEPSGDNKSEPPAGKALTLKDDWTGRFLTCYSQTGNITESCKLANVSRPTFYMRKERDPQFAKDVIDAFNDAIDALTEVARKRAVEKSDVLTIFLLKAMAPERFRDTAEVKHTGSVQQNHVVFTNENLKAIATAQESYKQKFGELPNTALALEVQDRQISHPTELSLKPEDAVNISNVREEFERNYGKE